MLQASFIYITEISCIEKKDKQNGLSFFLYRVKSDYSSTTTGLYFGTRVFMMIHPMRYATAQKQKTII